MNRSKTLIFCTAIFFLLSILFPQAARSQTEPWPPEELGDDLQVSLHPETGKVNFMARQNGKRIARKQAFGLLVSPETAARSFFSAYGSYFGLEKPAEELRLLRESRSEDGRTFVRFQQTYKDIPVFGGELIVQVGAGKEVLSASGEALPWKPASTQPVIDAEAARQAAVSLVSKHYGFDASALRTTEPELCIYNPALLGAPGPRITSLGWRLEVEPVELAPVRELVLVDAARGSTILNFNLVDSALYRKTYTAKNGTTLPGTLLCDETDPQCSTGNDEHAESAHRLAGDAYNFYMDMHNRDSIDRKGMSLVSTVHYGEHYENAFWNGRQMVYGDGYGFAFADDVIAHELTHGVTQYESNLFYYYQSGAINESFSDLWGEFVDLSNGRGNDSPSVRWLIGEDVRGYGAFRDMRYLTRFGSPNKMSSEYYWCSEDDAGGVHTNSGVNNKAVSLMTDGGSFNGKTINGIGMEKVARIYYKVQTELLTSGADYLDLYNNVLLACSILASTGKGGITASDCAQVRNALDVVEMNQQPAACAAHDVTFCPGGKSPAYIFRDDLETPSASKWRIDPTSGPQVWYYPQNPNPYTDLTYTTSGIYNFYGDNLGSVSDSSIAMKNSVPVPPGKDVYLHFRHAYGFEDDSSGTVFFDGGVVEYSVDDGKTWLDAGEYSDSGGYDGIINSNYDNPIGGRKAFSGTSNGYQSTRIKFNLENPGVRFRFRIGTDKGVHDWGWFIDDINIYTCPPVTATERVYLPAVLMNAGAWGTFFQDSFEGNFPGPWQVYDDSASGYTFGKRDCKPFSGMNSAWAVGGGSKGNSLACNGTPQGPVDSWLVYGPFDLRGIGNARLEFMLWQNTKASTEDFFWGVSNDETSFFGLRTRGNSGGWQLQSLDLSDYVGLAEVWVGFVFSSYGPVGYPGGVFIDDVVIKKCYGVCPPGAVSTVTAVSNLQAEEVSIQHSP